MRSASFFTDGYYHVFNRGVDKRIIFQRFGHYLRFLTTIRSILKTGSATPRSSYNQSLALSTKVDLLCYCLMPNHYHFLLKQKVDMGITEFMHKLNTSYTKFFNLNNNRTGRLFEYTFKAKSIESEPSLLHVSRYIHINPVIAGIITLPEEWRWSSYHDYVDIEAHPLCQTQDILASFSDTYSYATFTKDQIAYKLLQKQIENEKDEDALFL